MQRYLYFCPKCGFLGSAKHRNSYEQQRCSDCNGTMIYTGLSKEEWDSKTREEKDLLKIQFKSDLANAPSVDKIDIDNYAILRSLEKIGNDISTIKTIMVVWVLLNVIGAFIVLFNFIMLRAQL